MSGDALPHQVLDGDRLRELSSEVDAFVDPEGAPVDVVICGGAALALSKGQAGPLRPEDIWTETGTRPALWLW